MHVFKAAMKLCKPPQKANKWIVSDIPSVPKAFGIAMGLASEYNKKNIPCIEMPCGLVGGSLQSLEKITGLIVHG